MARPLRIEFSGAVWHVHNRGNNRGDIYLSDEDRVSFLDLLAEAVRRFHWVVIQYTLMTNHYHLLIETPEPTLSRGMKWLAGTYVQRFNRRHGQSGLCSRDDSRVISWRRGHEGWGSGPLLAAHGQRVALSITFLPFRIVCS
jgi:REP element-mobilizing transposase RayT